MGVKMVIILIWFALAVVVGALAAGKDRSGFGWFLLAMLISPLIAAIFLLIAGDRRPARCPFCDEKVKERARICPHCRNDIRPVGEIVIEREKQ